MKRNEFLSGKPRKLSDDQKLQRAFNVKDEIGSVLNRMQYMISPPAGASHILLSKEDYDVVEILLDRGDKIGTEYESLFEIPIITSDALPQGKCIIIDQYLAARTVNL